MHRYQMRVARLHSPWSLAPATELTEGVVREIARDVLLRGLTTEGDGYRLDLCADCDDPGVALNDLSSTLRRLGWYVAEVTVTRIATRVAVAYAVGTMTALGAGAVTKDLGATAVSWVVGAAVGALLSKYIPISIETYSADRGDGGWSLGPATA